MTKPLEIKINAIKEFIASPSLTRLARKYGINAMTLKRWVRQYRKMGVDDFTLDNLYRRPPNRLASALEEKIYLIKEREPGITLGQARIKFRSEGINVCLATIRRIWRSHGYIERQMALSSQQFAALRDNTQLLQQSYRVMNRRGSFSEAARFLNRMTTCQDLKILGMIPDRYLSMRRRLEKLDAMRSIEPMPFFYQRARQVRESLERRKYFFSTLQAGFVEASALSWLDHPAQGLALINHLMRVTPGKLSRYLRFRLLFYKGRFLADMLRTDSAMDCARQCETLMKSLNQFDLESRMSQLYSGLGDYRKARMILEKAVKRYKPEVGDGDIISQAVYAAIGGDYRFARRLANKLTNITDQYKPLYYVTLAYCQIGAGDLERALELSRKAVTHAQKEGFLNFLQASVIVQASVYAALGFRAEALKVIRKIMPLLARRKVKRDFYIHAILAGRPHVSMRFHSFPPIKMLIQLKEAGRTGRIGDYHAVLKYAIRKGLLGIFHRYCLLAPEAVAKQLARAKPTHLPSPILRLPVFNTNLPSFRIDILGRFKIYRQEKPLNIRLRPKDAAFFIHLMMARNSCLSLDRCIANFWPHATDPKSNLYHLLRRLRQKLMIPSQFLYVKNHVVHYKGSAISDFKIFQEALSLARALEAGREWNFANQEYQRAFKIFRGEPFRNMYDPWSDDERIRILNQLEVSAVAYANSCRSHGSAADGKMVLTVILKIIPESGACRKSLESLSTAERSYGG
jgi:transposase-like protein